MPRVLAFSTLNSRFLPRPSCSDGDSRLNCEIRLTIHTVRRYIAAQLLSTVSQLCIEMGQCVDAPARLPTNHACPHHGIFVGVCSSKSSGVDAVIDQGSWTFRYCAADRASRYLRLAVRHRSTDISTSSPVACARTNSALTQHIRRQSWIKDTRRSPNKKRSRDDRNGQLTPTAYLNPPLYIASRWGITP